MVATLALATLIEAARRVGVELHEVDTGGNLYIWHTPPPERAVVYVGKSASNKRLNEERSWQNRGDPTSQIFSGIITLLRVNRAVPQAIRYDPDGFDTSSWRNIRNKHDWCGPAFDHLEKALPAGGAMAASEVEKLLVRIAVRYGTPIGNSQFASQWEAPIGSVADTLAVLAIGDDPSFVIPPPYTETR